MTRVRDRLVDGPASLAAHFRAQRWELFSKLFPDLSGLKILDLGGTAETWRRAQDRPAHVTLVNLEPSDSQGEDWLEYVYGDACEPDTIGSARYDLVFSNSLLEHVGGYARRRALADVILNTAPRHWVQTPYRYFPVEPHWICPGMQFLPLAARITVARRWPLVHTRPASADEAAVAVLWTELIGAREMRLLFPGSTVTFERLGGFPKSLISYRL
jgi:hypothetical protein